jgi:hypothetical protein
VKQNEERKVKMQKVLTTICFVTLFIIGSTVHANTVASSTMYFETVDGYGDYTLTYDSGSGTYSGVIPMKVDAGFDIYAKEGATAYFGDGAPPSTTWDSLVIGSDHDGWPTWTPDTPDWYQYSLHLYEESSVQKWAIRNHAGATAGEPWYTDDTAAMGVPMSGTMNWTTMFAAETDTGAYLPGTGTSEIPGGAATKGGGAQCWDMDWSWGSEAVPLEYPGFSVAVTDLGEGAFAVTMTPVPEPVTMTLLALGGLFLRKRK